MSFLNRQRHWLFLLLAVVYILLFVFTAGGGFPLDDSWIHQSYGRNLGTLGEWALIPGVPSAASTAPLYTVLLSIGYALRIPFPLWTHLLGIFALWGIGWFGAQLADRALPKRASVGLLVGVLLISTWQLVWAGASGMETALFAMWCTLLPLLAWRELDEQRDYSSRLLMLRGVLFGIVAGLAMLTRPEGVLCAAIFGAGLLFHWRATPRRLALWAVGATFGFVICSTPYFWLNLTLTGGLLPSTSAAKQVQHAPLLAFSYPARLWWMVQPLWVGGQLFLIPGLVGYLVFGSRGRRFTWVLVAWSAALVGLYAARLPATYQHGRYVMPALPSIIVVGTVGTVWLVEQGRRRMLTRVLSQVLLFGAIASFFVMVLGVMPGIYERDVAVINQEMVASAQWIDENIPPDELLAIHDIGAVSYLTPRPIIDIAGLVTPEVVQYIYQPQDMWAYLQRQGAVYLMAFPNQIPGDAPNMPDLCEVFQTGGEAAIALGASNMAVYRLSWDAPCQS